MSLTIRPATPADVPQLLGLMRDLAVFEDYIDAFAVTEDDLYRHGFGPGALFQAHVADIGPEAAPFLVGMAVTYVVPWTYSLCPRLVLKELYVAPETRGSGAGRGLVSAVKAQAQDIGADHIAWTVMRGNRDAERFYRSVGGAPDAKWHNWVMPVTDPGTDPGGALV